MSSRKSSDRHSRHRRILANPFNALVPCDFCSSRNRCCVYIADFSLMPCAECARRGKECVTSSWEKLDRVDDDLAAKIEADKKEMDETTREALRLFSRMSELQARIDRNSKVRDANNKLLNAKIACVSREVSSSDGNPPPDLESFAQDLEAIGVSSPFGFSGNSEVRL